MAAQNFRIKNGLSVGTTEVIDSSGDLTAAAFGTAAKEAIDDQVNTVLTAGSNISLTYDDAAGTLTVAGQAGDITGVTAGDGLSGGGTSGGVSLALDLNELTAASVDVAADSIAIVDGGDNSSKKESIADLATAMAGTGITATNGVFSATQGDITAVTAGNGISGGGASGDVSVALDLSELTEVTIDNANDSMVLIDASDSSSSKKETVADFVSAMAGSGLNAASGVLSISETGDISAVTAGDGLSGGGTSGAVTLALDHNELTAAAVDVANDSISIIDASDSNATRKESIADLATAMAGTNITATNGVLSTTADLTGVTAGDGLSGGGTSGAVSLALDLNELTGATLAVADDSIPFIDASDNSSKKESVADIVTAVAGDGLAASSGVLAVGVDGSSLEISSDALQVKASGVTNTMLAGSIANAKLANSTITIAGSSTALGGTVLADTDALSEGSSNLYHTSERVDDRVNALITEGTGITATYDDAAGTLTLATTITQYTEALVRGDVSVTDAGGDGSLAYNNSTGVFTYTGPSAAEVRAHITAGTGVGISSGEVSIGQAVATSSNVQFANLTLSGDLTVNGSTVTNSATNTTIEDALIELGSGNSGSNSNDLGLILERGSTGNNGFMGWDESADSFILGTTTDTGSSTGDLTITVAPLSVGAVTITNASNSGGTARNVYQSTSAPGGSDGAVGDLWILYS